MINLRSSEHADMYFIILHKELLETCYNKNQDSKGKTKILKVKMAKKMEISYSQWSKSTRLKSRRKNGNISLH